MIGNSNTFTIYWQLKQEQFKNPDKLAPSINSVFERFPYYKHNTAELREFKAKLYKLLLPVIRKEQHRAGSASAKIFWINRADFRSML
jgi:hypothetical protein